MRTTRYMHKVICIRQITKHSNFQCQSYLLLRKHCKIKLHSIKISASETYYILLSYALCCLDPNIHRVNEVTKWFPFPLTFTMKVPIHKHQNKIVITVLLLSQDLNQYLKFSPKQILVLNQICLNQFTRANLLIFASEKNSLFPLSLSYLLPGLEINCIQSKNIQTKRNTPTYSNKQHIKTLERKQTKKGPSEKKGREENEPKPEVLIQFFAETVICRVKRKKLLIVRYRLSFSRGTKIEVC